MRPVLAITWFAHRRTTELCAGLGVELAVISTPLRGALRYVVLGVRTLGLLLRRRPGWVLVQNPSLVLAAMTLMLRFAFGYRVMTDAHNEAVAPLINRSRLLVALSRWVVRHADVTIVTNRQLAMAVQRLGGKAFILPDRVPSVPSAPAPRLSGAFNLVLIATFAPDEPIAEVLEAVRGTDLQLHVTGNYQKLARAVLQATPPNVRFAGFLDEASYWSLLRSADAIVDLTTMDDCLVCGAYEALALSKPMLLSNNAAGVELFGNAAVFTDNSATQIRSALERVRRQTDTLAAAAQLKRGELAQQWNESADRLRGILAG